jgi:serine/threonine protein kinase
MAAKYHSSLCWVQDMLRERYGVPIRQFRLGAVVQTTECSVLYESVDTISGGTAIIEIANRIRFNSPKEIRDYYTRAKKLGGLEHPNIQLPETFSISEGNNPFFIWSSLPRHNLWSVLKRNGPLPEESLRKIFSQVCDALICAANADVWRDAIYPSQLLFDETFQTVKLAGFETDLIHSLETYGSPKSTVYKAPETGLRMAAFDRGHVYLVGCLMYEARTTVPLALPDSYMTRYEQEAIDWLY